MGIMDALAGGLSEAAGGAAKIGFDMIQSQIDQDRAAALIQMQEESRGRSDTLTRSRNKADATEERARVAEFSKPIESQPSGLMAQGAGANDADNAGADENLGFDAQKRERPATFKESAGRAAVAGDLNSAKAFEGLDNADEKIRAAQAMAEIRQRYNTDRLTQQGQMAMMKLAASIAKQGADGKLPSEAKMIEYLVKEQIVPDKKAAAEWVKQGKQSGQGFVEEESDAEGNVMARKTRTPTSGTKKPAAKEENDPLGLRKK